MYPSDYEYAAGESCSTSTSDYQDGCNNSDYLFSGENEWLQTSCSNNSYSVNMLHYVGAVTSDVANRLSFAVRPVLYLTSQTKITGGEGSSEIPFILG